MKCSEGVQVHTGSRIMVYKASGTLVVGLNNRNRDLER